VGRTPVERSPSTPRHVAGTDHAATAATAAIRTERGDTMTKCSARLRNGCSACARRAHNDLRGTYFPRVSQSSKDMPPHVTARNRSSALAGDACHCIRGVPGLSTTRAISPVTGLVALPLRPHGIPAGYSTPSACCRSGPNPSGNAHPVATIELRLKVHQVGGPISAFLPPNERRSPLECTSAVR
jgi:hypothetical protein